MPGWCHHGVATNIHTNAKPHADKGPMLQHRSKMHEFRWDHGIGLWFSSRFRKVNVTARNNENIITSLKNLSCVAIARKEEESGGPPPRALPSFRARYHVVITGGDVSFSGIVARNQHLATRTTSDNRRSRETNDEVMQSLTGLHENGVWSVRGFDEGYCRPLPFFLSFFVCTYCIVNGLVKNMKDRTIVTALRPVVTATTKTKKMKIVKMVGTE